MHLKRGVKLDKLQPQMIPAMMAVDKVWYVHGLDPTLTSGNDGKHRVGSLHYLGLALDFRTRDISSTKALFFRDRLKEMLGDEYDVIIEYDPLHMHIEYDPK